MTIIGRRGSSDSGWIWEPAPEPPAEPPEPAEPPPAEPPSEPPPPPPEPEPPFLPLAGLALVLALIALAALGVWLSEAEERTDAHATVTPVVNTPFVASPVPTPTPTAAPTPTPTPPPEATPTPSPTPDAEAHRYVLTVWDGEAWRFSPPSQASFQEGAAVPFMLRLGGAEPGDPASLTIRYDCRAFDVLTTYTAGEGTTPALASGGPGDAQPDSTIAIPGSADDASLSLWGGVFGQVARQTTEECAGEPGLDVSVTALSDSLFLLWAAVIAPDASALAEPLQMTVEDATGRTFQLEIEPEMVTPAES